MNIGMDSSYYNDSSQKRMAELQKAAQKNKYGYMFSITRAEYVRQVTEASQEIPVVVFLYKDRYPFICNLIIVSLIVLWKIVRFLKKS